MTGQARPAWRRTATALAATVLAAVALTGCDGESALTARPEPSPTATATVKPTETLDPKVPHHLRFDRLVRNFSTGVRTVDLTTATSQTTLRHIEYTMFGPGKPYRIHVLDIIDTEYPEWCVVDTDQKVWYYFRADQKVKRAVYLLGDGVECRPGDESRIHTIAELTAKKGLTFRKSSQATRKLLRYVLTRPPGQ